MYAILSGGRLVAISYKPRYVRLNLSSGCYIESAPEDAIAISVNGDLYNIEGSDAIPGAPEAIVREDDVGEYVFDNHARIIRNEQSTGVAVVQLEEALCEQDAVTEERLTAVEEALCELDSAINGGR